MTTSIVTVLFTDVVDSTGVLARDGAHRSEAIRREHFAAMRRAVHQHRGEEIKTTGDGLMIVFKSALDAVEAAVTMQRAVARLRREDSSCPEIRVGMSAGEATVEDGDWYGQPVVEAARLCELAGAGQILLADIVVMLIRTWNKYPLVSAGEQILKGFDQPIPISQVEWTDETEVGVLPLPSAITSSESQAFVGREQEYASLMAAWTQARNGVRRAVFVSGEPGIGKTRLAIELARHAHAEGATVLWGRCDEELQLVYQPFAEPLRHYVAHRPPDVVLADLGAHGADLARLVPDLAEWTPGQPASPRAAPNAKRQRLFEAVAMLLAGAARSAPVLMVLDDLQWAARGALLLLRHLVRDARPVSMLIVGTYRTTDLDRHHPLAELLADLRRERSVERLELSGLDAPEIATLLEEVVGGGRLDAAVKELASLVHAETEGNPFFVVQVLRHLIETGVVYEREGSLSSHLSLDQIGIPEGVREVIGRRLWTLSDATNRMLNVAAVMGHEFELRILERVPDAAGSEAALLDALEEAVAARLVSELAGPPGRFGFTHTLVRQTLLENISAARRARLHRYVAQAIESLPGGPATYVDELAFHYWACASDGCSDKAVSYAQRAATEAVHRLAYDDAVVQLERALSAMALSNTNDPETRARVFLGLAEARQLAGDVAAAKSAADDAAKDARSAGSAQLLARAALWRSAFPEAGVEDRATVRLLHEALHSGGQIDERMRSSLLSQWALYRAVNAGQGPLADTIAQEAVEVARASGDTVALARALMNRCLVLQGSPNLPEQHEHFEQLANVLDVIPSRLRVAAEKVLLRSRGVVYLQAGDIAAFDHDLAALARLGDGTGDWLNAAAVTMWRSMRALLDGRLDDAETLAAEMVHHAPDESNVRHSYVAQIFQLRREQGRLGEIEGLIDAAAHDLSRLGGFRAAVALIRAELGDLDGARSGFEEMATGDFIYLPWDLTRTASLALLAENCSILDDRERAGYLYHLLLPYAGQLVVAAWGTNCLGAADRYLGILAATERRFESAESHFEAALALETRVDAPPLIARTRCAYARALAMREPEHDGRSAAALLDAAACTAQQLGLRGLERPIDETRRAVAATQGALST